MLGAEVLMLPTGGGGGPRLADGEGKEQGLWAPNP